MRKLHAPVRLLLALGIIAGSFLCVQKGYDLYVWCKGGDSRGLRFAKTLSLVEGEGGNIELTNVGSQVVKIVDVAPSCSCIVTAFPKSIGLQQTAAIKFQRKQFGGVGQAVLLKLSWREGTREYEDVIRVEWKPQITTQDGSTSVVLNVIDLGELELGSRFRRLEYLPNSADVALGDQILLSSNASWLEGIVERHAADRLELTLNGIVPREVGSFEATLNASPREGKSEPFGLRIRGQVTGHFAAAPNRVIRQIAPGASQERMYITLESSVGYSIREVDWKTIAHLSGELEISMEQRRADRVLLKLEVSSDDLRPGFRAKGVINVVALLSHDGTKAVSEECVSVPYLVF